jgi:hypothetical protein
MRRLKDLVSNSEIFIASAVLAAALAASILFRTAHFGLHQHPRVGADASPSVIAQERKLPPAAGAVLYANVAVPANAAGALITVGEGFVRVWAPPGAGQVLVPGLCPGLHNVTAIAVDAEGEAISMASAMEVVGGRNVGDGAGAPFVCPLSPEAWAVLDSEAASSRHSLLKLEISIDICSKASSCIKILISLYYKTRPEA